MTLEEMIEEKARELSANDHGADAWHGFKEGTRNVYRDSAKEELVSEYAERNPVAMKALLEGRGGVYELAFIAPGNYWPDKRLDQGSGG